MIDDKVKEEILADVMEEFADRLKDAAREAVEEAEIRVLPYLLEDTDANALFQARDIVQAILAGNFEHDGGYITVRHPRGNARIPLMFTASDYDHLRDRIIERMVTCPKDAKIEQLEQQLADISRRMYRSY